MKETEKIRAQGFPHRIEYPELFDKYKPLGLKGASQKQAQALMTVMAFKPEVFACGNTKLFLKSDAYAAMEKRLVAALRKWAVKIQALARMIISRGRFIKMQKAASVIGKNVRIMQRNAKLKRCVVRAFFGKKKKNLGPHEKMQVAALLIAKECEKRRRLAAANLIKKNWRAVLCNRKMRKYALASLVVAKFCERERERVRREAAEKKRLEDERKRAKEEERKRVELEQKRLQEERKREEDEMQKRESMEKKKASKEEAKRRQLELIKKEEEEEARLADEARLAAEQEQQKQLQQKRAAVAPATSSPTSSSGSIKVRREREKKLNRGLI